MIFYGFVVSLWITWHAWEGVSQGVNGNCKTSIMSFAFTSSIFCKLIHIYSRIWTTWINIYFNWCIVGHETPLSLYKRWGVSWRMNCACISSSMNWDIKASNFVYLSTQYAYLNKANKYKYHLIFLMLPCEFCLQVLNVFFNSSLKKK